MADKYQRQRNRMLEETSDRKVRYRLYKSGKNWVIAGVSTLILSTAVFVGNGAVAKAATPSADTTPATSDSTTGALSTDGDSTVLKTGSSDSTTAPTESEPTTSATAGKNVATTGTSTENDATDEAKDASDTGKTVADATDSTKDDASELLDSTGSSTQEKPNTTAATSTGTENTNSTVTTNVNPTNSTNDATKTDSGVTATTVGNTDEGTAKTAAVATDSAAVLSDVTATAVDVTGKLPHSNINQYYTMDGHDYMTMGVGYAADNKTLQSIYGISATGQVIRIPYVNGAWSITSATVVKSAITQKLVLTTYGDSARLGANGWYQNTAPIVDSNGTGYVPQGITVSATNTRMVGDALAFTNATQLTVKIPTNTVTLPTGVTGVSASLILSDGVWAQGVTSTINATMSGNKITYAVQNVTTKMIADEKGNLGRDIEIDVKLKLADTLDGDTYFVTRSLLTKSAVESYVLTPTVINTNMGADSTTLNGSAYRASDTIILKDANNNTLATTTPDANGYWTFDLASLNLTTSSNLFVQEDGTHAYGDGDGVATVPQYTKATRTITYVDAVTGKTLDTTTSDMTLTRANSIARTDGVALTALTATKDTKYTITPGTYKNTDTTATDGLNFSAITNANLETFDGYTTNANLAAIAAVPGQDVAQTVYEYPTQLTVDPNADPDNLTTAVVTPKTGNTPINTTDKAVTYPSGISEADLTNTVTRTVNYVDAAGNSIANKMPAVTETAYFTRTATLTLNTDSTGYDVAYGDWTLKKVNNADVADQVISDETPYSFGTVDTSGVAGMTYVSTSDSPATVSKTDLDAMVADKTKAALATTVTYDYIALTPKITSIAQNADGKTIMQGTGTLAGDTLFMVDKNNAYHG